MPHFYPKNLTVKSFAEGLKNRDFKAREVAEYFLKEIEKANPELNAYLSVFAESAIEEAKAVDRKIEVGSGLPPLAGVPIALKDNILVEGTKKTTAGSKILEFYEASYDAYVVERLRAQDAVFLGKTNLDEFAMGSSTENSAFGPTKNPYDLLRTPGGSSGGSVAAVAAGLALAALGSDTGGSIRQPAAFCGVVGLRPTYGEVSRRGLIAMASSLDQIGTITKNVEDAAILFDAIRGADDFDSTSADSEKVSSPTHLHKDDFREMVIGVPQEYMRSDLDPAVLKGMEYAMDKFKTLGFKIVPVSLPHTHYALAAYYIIVPAEVSTNLARFDGIRYRGTKNQQPTTHNLSEIYLKTRGEGFGDEVKRRILLGTFVLSAGHYDAYYAKAQKVRSLISRDFDEAWKKVDVIFAPTTPTTAFKLGDKSADPISMYLSDVFTIPANLAGLPSISIPVKKYDLGGGELPVGFQLIGRHFHERAILGVGELYESL